MTRNAALQLLIKTNPKIKFSKKGFPNIGCRQDGLKYGKEVRKIEQAWYYYDTDLYNIATNEPIIKLGSGNPINYKSFEYALRYLNRKLKKDKLYEYPPAAGDEYSRQIICEYLIKNKFPENLNYNNIIITNSTTEGFYLILKSIFRPYDVILMTGPNYGLFAFMPERLNINVEIIPLEKEDDYLINPLKLEKKINSINNKLKHKYKNLNYIPKVRAFLNINPHNPMGTVLTEDDTNLLKEIGNICQKNGIFIIDDLIYRDLSYNRKKLAKPIGTIHEYFDNTISLMGLSKSYGLAKTRAGFIVANEIVIRLLRDNLFYIMDSSSVLQSTLLAGTFNNYAIRNIEYQKYFKKLIPIYEFNCALTIAIFEGINSIKNNKYYHAVYCFIKKNTKKKLILNQLLEGIPYAKVVVQPQSGFFILIDFTELKNNGIIKNEKELLDYLYKTCGTKFLIGQSFSWSNKDEIIIRISYSLEKRILLQAYTKINLSIREMLK